jgi:DNA-binding beta-propeller fold protein YncE
MTTRRAFVPDNPSTKNSKFGMKNDIWLVRLVRLFSIAVIATAQPLFAAALAPQPPVELPNTHGKFDFIKVDSARGRLLACHTGNGSLDVIDESTSKLLKSIPTGNAQGVAIDDKGGRYFVSVSKPPQLVIIDAVKLEATGTVTLSGPADVCAYSATLNRVAVDNDEKPEQWIIDPDAKKIVQDITYPGSGMEDLCFDATGTLIFQNLKDSDEVVESDPITGKIKGHWATAPASKPHGLALIDGGDALAVAGGNGRLVVIITKQEKKNRIVVPGDIAPRVDEIAYDPDRFLIFAASGTGTISIRTIIGTVLNVSGVQNAGDVPSSPGAHSIAVDPKTRTVWIAFAKDDKAYVQSFLESGH